MKDRQLEETIIRAARKLPEDGNVPYRFERRIMARLRAERIVDPLALWARGLWRAVLPCLALMIMVGIWSQAMGDRSDLLANDLELTLMQPLEELEFELFE